jgi:hypothetical protein
MSCGFVSVIASLSATPSVPSPDPLGYPVPTWIMQALSYLTLTLHLSAVHFTVGGALLLLWAHLRKRPGHDEIVHFFGSGLPLGVSYIITLGIPPLLFVQVMYGQLFYASSVLVGAFWIQVIPAVLLAYAGLYYHKLKRGNRPHLQGTVVAVCALLLMYVGYIYTNNLTLSMSPEKWMGLYARAPGGGVLHHGEPTVHPRYLLFLSSAFAVAGLALIWRGVFLARWGLGEAGRRSRLLGFRAFLLSPVLWVIAGIGVYLARPEDVQSLLSDGGVTWILIALGVASAVVAVSFAHLAVDECRLAYSLISSLGMVMVTGCLVILRDLVRLRVLGGHWDSSTIPVRAQWGMFALFVVTLAAGVVLLVVLGVKVLPGIAAGARRRLEERSSAGKSPAEGVVQTQ